jgi:fructose-1,6-bisphosphatase I
MLVYSTGSGVHGFTLDPDLGEFLLTNEQIRIPERPRYYSANHAYINKWSAGVRQYIDWLQRYDYFGKGLSERYIGSLVADFHRNLINGGVFLYPGQKSLPQGKLRLLYEAGPLAFLVSQAGGYASDGHGPILDLEPQELHQRVPLFIGNQALVKKAEELIRLRDKV